MATIHGARLSQFSRLLGPLPRIRIPKFESIVTLIVDVHELLHNEAQPPSASFLRKVSVPFHRTLLQILVNAARCLKITGLLEATNLVVDALRLKFDSARTHLDLDLDRDMELIVAVFEECIKPDVRSSSSLASSY
jgi:nuclear pore complex protein Nup188